MSRLKLLIVDDSNVIRRAIEKYLNAGQTGGNSAEPAKNSYELVGTAGDGETALRMFSLYKPDLVTLDITMPRMDGLSCLEKMLSLKPGAKILVISALKDPSTGLKALKKGAAGFLLKPFTAEQLRAEVEAITPAVSPAASAAEV
jgi:two-component system chemotaxis response regulator CheY